MSSVIHIAEVAVLLTLAYALGWLVGYVARRIASRPAAVQPTIPAERIAAVTGAAAPDALVKAPIIVPVANEAPPAAPVPEAEPVVAVAEPSTPPLSSIVIPTIAAPPPLFPPVPEALPPAAPEPVVAEPPPQLPPAFTATPAMRPGEAWSGEVKGKPAEPFRRAVEAVVPEAITEPEPADVMIVAPPVEESSTPVAVLPAKQPEAPPPAREYDEDEAMRAIEGGWSRVKARAMPDAPELHDVGAAVAAAQTAVEQVLAQAGIDPAQPSHTGKPKGLTRPRPDGRDDLKRINGLGALDESTLNNLGFYHFDQIVAWNEHDVLWMESHVFAPGRIGREEWQGQARALVATVDS